VDGASVRFGGEEECVPGFGGETLRVRDNVEDLGIDSRVIL
jgi:hypothetical protein